MARRRTISPQLTLDQARKPVGHGGWRPGAGRPRGRKTVSHDARERFPGSYPLHVTLRIEEGVRSLRSERVATAVRAAFTAGGRSAAFRVVEFAILGNHLHLIIEANSQAALSRGMTGLGTRLSRRINAALDRTGPLFAARYHARVLRTPSEVNRAVRYVLLNARRHAAAAGRALCRGWIDPYSSGPWFEGWREPSRCDADWLVRLRRLPRPTAEPTTWLLATGWRRHGLLVVDDVPGERGMRR